MAEHIMGKSALQVMDLLRKHDPAVSDEQIADVVSEWGHLLDEPSEQEGESAEFENTEGVTG
jgi:hypothetical protein